MVTVQVGASEEQDLATLDEGWVLQQIARRRAEGGAVCIQVRIVEPGLRIHLASPECGGGGSRRPTAAEMPFLDLWVKSGLDQRDVPPGRVIEFLRHLRRLLRA